MKYTLKLLIFSGLIFCWLPSFAQKKYNEYSTNRIDPRFTITARYDYSSMSEYEEVVYYVQNHTNRELQLELEATVYYTCDRTKTYLLGVNKVVYLPPNGQFKPSSDWSHLLMTSNKKKECLLKGPNGYTTSIRSFHFNLISVRDLTSEKEKKAKEDEEKKKLAEETKAKKDKFNEKIKIADIAIAAKNYKEAEIALNEAQRILPDNTIVSSKRDQIKRLQDQELLAAKKKEEQELQKKRAAETAAAVQNSGSGSVTGGKSSSSSSNSESSKGSSESGSSKLSTNQSNSATTANAEDAQQNKRDYEESQRLARETAARQAEAKRVAEEQEAKERQQKYDEWKEKKNQERQVQEAASMAASASFLYFFGEIIYGGMETYNPEHSYQAPVSAEDKYKPLFYAGVDVGYSGSYFPMLFNSQHSTMVNGNYINENSIITKDVITVNLNVIGKVGIESENYGAYAYLAPQAGFSPVFDAFTLSPFVGGFKTYGGIKWIKAYLDYRTGVRQINTYSLDAEEYGEGNFNNKFNKLEYGIRFTTNPDTDYRRSHISIGMISETFTAEDEARFLNPVTNSLSSGKTPAIKGYSLQWKKDHAFNAYVNVFPEYIYGGDIASDSGSLKIDYSENTGVYVEFGFIRSFDFFNRR
jgi:hypothetical protein